MSQSGPRYRCAFTIVELLVVMSIIILLLAIILPSAKRARATAKLAVCQAQQHQISIAAMSYSCDHFGSFMPHTPDPDTSFGGGVWAVAQKIQNPNKAKYRGAGLLISEGYISEPRVLYCPEWSFPGFGYGELSDMLPGQGGWPEAQQAVMPTGLIKCSYHYRASYTRGIDGSKGRRFRASDPGNLAIMADHWTDHIKDAPGSEGVGEGIFGHSYLTGYNVAYIDGHIRYKPDFEQYIMNSNVSKTDHDLIELFWRNWFDAQ
ncbi:MAG: hypothetical protein GC159_06325 [Phycisphaera sp.]|nr:hypothetical protein [Phycisphaera sp.]